jgi:hypothetical protein
LTKVFVSGSSANLATGNRNTIKRIIESAIRDTLLAQGEAGLVSVNGWADGQRARHAARKVPVEVKDVHPKAQSVLEFYPIR